MTTPSRGTDRPFTVIVCSHCAARHGLSVIEELRPAIRRCPRSVLVSAACMLGPLTCASRPTSCGVMAVVQPCTDDRVACGPAHWVGPITDNAGAAALGDWLADGRWESRPVPDELAGHRLWTRAASNN